MNAKSNDQNPSISQDNPKTTLSEPFTIKTNLLRLDPKYQRQPINIEDPVEQSPAKYDRSPVRRGL